MIRTRKRMRLCTTLLVGNLILIWGNSLLPGEISGTISDWVRDLLASLLPGGAAFGPGGGLIRKLAHFTEFTMLGMCLSWFFGMLQKNRIWPLLCGVAAACIDETIQRFVPDRGPSLWDVGIDTCGVITGILFLAFGYLIIRRKQLYLEDIEL